MIGLQKMGVLKGEDFHRQLAEAHEHEKDRLRAEQAHAYVPITAFSSGQFWWLVSPTLLTTYGSPLQSTKKPSTRRPNSQVAVPVF